MKKSFYLISSTLFLGVLLSFILPEEGMFPLSDLNKLDLNAAGLNIPKSQIFDTKNPSLNDALVRVGGCTGSFVSENGLIITNHHCAFGATRAASTPQTDYLNDGLKKEKYETEIPAEGLTCRITESYEDVSVEILEAANKAETPSDRLKLIAEKIEEIEIREQNANPELTVEVSEMFVGKQYVLFRYTTLLDVRLVYVPMRSIGEFGGESDNWIWPRHTGDFSFMRAYVGTDGKPAAYNKKNVPFKPKKFLKVNPKGVDEEDFVFILGYPGRTFRHNPSYYIDYQEQFQLPYISELYKWKNEAMEEFAGSDRKLQLKFASTIKGNANVLKNYQGKLQGLKTLKLVKQKKTEEDDLKEFIAKDQKMKSLYGNLFSEMEVVYKGMNDDAMANLWYGQLLRGSPALLSGYFVASLQNDLKNVPKAEQMKFLSEKKASYINSVNRGYASFELELDKKFVKKMIEDANQFKQGKQINALKGMFDSEKDIENFLKKVYSKSEFTNSRYFEVLMDRGPKEVIGFSDPIVKFMAELLPQYKALSAENNTREGTLNKLLGDYVTVKSAWKKTDFVPDANATLRLTYGYVRGYSPSDGVSYSPITTLSGLIEKGADEGDYKLPEIIRELYAKRDFGKFLNPKLNDVPVALLYNTDTSGGNSGSPIMDKNGDLVGVNFDRAYHATINDFAWNESYSRSIGVDIRYVLWVAQKVDKADFLLKEMGVL